MTNRLIVFLLVLFQAIVLIADDGDWAFVSLTLNLAFSICYSLQKPSERAPLFAFVLSFFILLLSRLYIPFIYDPDKLTYQSMFTAEAKFLPECYRQLSLALLSVVVLYMYSSSKKEHSNVKPINFESAQIKSLRKCAKVLSIFTSVFFLYNAVELAISNITMGYMSLYDGTTVTSTLISFTGGKFNFCMYLYFATMPCKKECKKMLLLFFICNAITLLSGVRNNFVIPAIFLVLYLTFRNKINSGGEVWLSRKSILALIGIFPFFMILLYATMVLRAGKDFNDINLADGLLSSIYQLGSSIEVIHNGIKYESFLHEQHWFSLTPIFDLFVHNPITDLIFDIPRIQQHTIERATQAGDISASLTYIDNPSRYFAFGGIGSSYVTEGWIDMGYPGIILYSSIYGYILGAVWRWMNKSVWQIFFVFVVIAQIIYAPRSWATALFTVPFEAKSWPYLLIAYYYYKHPYKR